MKKGCFGLLRGNLAKHRGGAAAVEFAMIAPLFLALIFSILEAGYFFFVSSAVDQASARAARLIRTGQAQSETTPISKAAFYNEICKVVRNLGDCSTRLTVEVTRFADFDALAADTSAPTCRDADDTAVGAIPYAVGQQREIVRVRICFLHKTMSPGLGLDLAQAPDGSRKLISVVIFRNEPFNS